MLVNLLLCYKSLPNSLGQLGEGITIATLNISAGDGSLGGCMQLGRRRFVGHPEIGNGTAVAYHHILESPLVAQNLLKQSGAAAAWLVIPTLVGAHHLAHLCLLHKVLECRHIGFPQVAWRHIVYIGMMTAPFRTAVYGIVLGAGKQLAVLG